MKLSIILLIALIVGSCGDGNEFNELVIRARENGRIKYKIATLIHLNKIKDFKPDMREIDRLYDSLNAIK